MTEMAKGFGNMMKQAQKLQKQMMEMQEELGEKRIEGTAGGGMVTVVANGRQEVLEVKIDPDVVDPEDVEMLEDLVLAALTSARENVQKMVDEEMSGMMPGLSGMGLPGLG
jgi:hypothetical protein